MTSVAPALVTSRSVEWTTPPDVFALLDAEFGFTLDPCATPENATCAMFFTESEDGLAQPWAPEIVFCNPPYGSRETGKWVRKGFEEAERGATVVLLLPARTDTRWWHEFCSRGEKRFLPGRLRFGDGESPAPFPSAVVVFRPRPRAVTVLVRKCDVCGAFLCGKRRHAKTCSDKCRQRAHRAKTPRGGRRRR
jgi:site-specific DNA-methyltransferase (adenine-specific)